jgi:alpha-D-ribose 1-methylphosphonate 5-triphosphate synthase subunit PhnG
MTAQPTFTQGEALSVLTHAPAEAVKTLAEALLERIGNVEVLISRTGLAMLPYRDSAQGAVFHLGEVLVAEAHIRIEGGAQGYGLVLGRDLEFAMAVAVIDAALSTEINRPAIEMFLEAQRQAQAAADDLLLRQVAATRIELETF